MLITPEGYGGNYFNRVVRAKGKEFQLVFRISICRGSSGTGTTK